MKRSISIIGVSILILAITGCQNQAATSESENTLNNSDIERSIISNDADLEINIIDATIPTEASEVLTITATFEDGTVGTISDLHDNQTTREFLDMLPLTVTMNDWDSREYYISHSLDYDAADATTSYAVGEFTYWCGGWITAYYDRNEDNVIEAGSVVLGIMNDTMIEKFQSLNGASATITFEISE